MTPGYNLRVTNLTVARLSVERMNPIAISESSGVKMNYLRSSLWYVVPLLLLATGTNLSAADKSSLDTRRQQFKQLLADEWEYELKESPEQATLIGDYRYNDRFSDASLAHVQIAEKGSSSIGWRGSKPWTRQVFPNRRSLVTP